MGHLKIQERIFAKREQTHPEHKYSLTIFIVGTSGKIVNQSTESETLRFFYCLDFLKESNRTIVLGFCSSDETRLFN